MAVSIWLASYYCRYQSLAQSRLTKISATMFLVSKNVGLPHILLIPLLINFNVLIIFS